jgi:hexulose-6-phosphate isomerase
MSYKLNRREFGKVSSLGLASTAAFLPGFVRAQSSKPFGRILKSIKFGMFGEKISTVEKFKILKEIGYDGVELNSPGGVNKDEALSASRETGFPIHGVVDSIHWGTRLSSPDQVTRAKGLQGLKTALLILVKWVVRRCYWCLELFEMQKMKIMNKYGNVLFSRFI